tara:strand:- start:56 stop:358 length:303 start_codon:yes stop_codon:yes gene_type:complete
MTTSASGASAYSVTSHHPRCPTGQSTGDQWFDERQFEAYRELGYQLCKQALTETGDLIGNRLIPGVWRRPGFTNAPRVESRKKEMTEWDGLSASANVPGR